MLSVTYRRALYPVNELACTTMLTSCAAPTLKEAVAGRPAARVAIVTGEPPTVSGTGAEASRSVSSADPVAPVTAEATDPTADVAAEVVPLPAPEPWAGLGDGVAVAAGVVEEVAELVLAAAGWAGAADPAVPVPVEAVTKPSM